MPALLAVANGTSVIAELWLHCRRTVKEIQEVTRVSLGNADKFTAVETARAFEGSDKEIKYKNGELYTSKSAAETLKKMGFSEKSFFFGPMIERHNNKVAAAREHVLSAFSDLIGGKSMEALGHFTGVFANSGMNNTALTGNLLSELVDDLKSVHQAKTNRGSHGSESDIKTEFTDLKGAKDLSGATETLGEFVRQFEDVQTEIKRSEDPFLDLVARHRQSDANLSAAVNCRPSDLLDGTSLSDAVAVFDKAAKSLDVNSAMLRDWPDSTESLEAKSAAANLREIATSLDNEIRLARQNDGSYVHLSAHSDDVRRLAALCEKFSSLDPGLKDIAMDLTALLGRMAQD